jgi:DNA-binding GntR family transcriptional regulator
MTDWSGRPAYAQLADALRADIRGGRYAPGSQLPSYEAQYAS